MKHMHRLASLLLALALFLAMAPPAMATQGQNDNSGTITINDAIPGQTYKAYQILYLESYNSETGAYAYKANSAWESWLQNQSAYVSIDGQGYVTWVQGADAATFAKLAQAEATKQDSTITADATVTAPAAAEGATTSTVTFENLNLGYYLVDTTLGTLCSLDTTNPSVQMFEKNTPPSIEKQVQEDSNGNWGESNTAQIGDTVNFKTTIYAKPGAQNYVLHDVMSAGLTLDADSITVKVGDKTLSPKTEEVTQYDYILTTPTNHSTDQVGQCTFEITFAQTYLDTITTNTEIVVTYSAILNGDAVISTNPNTNETKLDYGDGSETVWDETKTFSFSFDIVKTKTGTENEETGTTTYPLLGGAEFALYGAQTGDNLIPLVKDGDNYRVATTAEREADGFISATIVATKGRATVIGLDANTTYWLEETKQPNGYNKLAGRVEVAIQNENISTSLESSSENWTENKEQDTNDGGVHIINNTGAELPSTGGMGTTIFYVVGSILLVGAVVLLVVKKRMGSAK